ncbi:MAG TPA: ABC transporter ATP-binding protein [Savagea sp.]
MTGTVVEIKNLTKKIGSKTLIDDVSLQLKRGVITGFLGPNGAGKTTTIRMMVGLMKPTAGDVFINGHSIQTDYEAAMKKVGVIVENPEMYGYMSGYKNLIHFARMHNGDVTKERIDEVVAQLGLTNRIHEKVKTYSLGMRQRLGLAQALLHQPEFLILDEPTNGLDPAGIREFRLHLRRLAEEQNVAVFVSSHMLSEMELMCDEIAVIQNGRLIDVKKIKDQDETTTLRKVRVEVGDQARAMELLVASGFSVEVQGKHLQLDCEKEQIPQFIKQLVDADIPLFEIRHEKQTLEDEFIAMTGGGQIAQSR